MTGIATIQGREGLAQGRAEVQGSTMMIMIFIRGYIKREATVLIKNSVKFLIRNNLKRGQDNMKRKQINMVKIDTTVVTLIGIYLTERKRE